MFVHPNLAPSATLKITRHFHTRHDYHRHSPTQNRWAQRLRGNFKNQSNITWEAHSHGQRRQLHLPNSHLTQPNCKTTSHFHSSPARLCNKPHNASLTPCESAQRLCFCRRHTCTQHGRLRPQQPSLHTKAKRRRSLATMYPHPQRRNLQTTNSQHTNRQPPKCEKWGVVGAQAIPDTTLKRWTE